MKALILAAGLGTRLAPLTENYPKSLVKVNGKAILIKQIENLYKNGISDITIISGYKAEVLENEVKNIYPNVRIVKNEDYNKTNNMYSAYIAKKYIMGDEFLMMNADVFFDASVIEMLLRHNSQNSIVTDIGNYLEESMKVVEKNGRLTKISKSITKEEALGASIDVYKFSVDGGISFFSKCAEYIEDKKELNMWSEVALNDILSKIEFKACPLSGRWLEIDNHEDLKAAERLFIDECTK